MTEDGNTQLTNHMQCQTSRQHELCRES